MTKSTRKNPKARICDRKVGYTGGRETMIDEIIVDPAKFSVPVF
jgi:hypothetical protein